MRSRHLTAALVAILAAGLGLVLNTAVVVDRAGDVVRETTDVTADLATALQTNLAGGVDGTAGVADDLARFVEVVERFIPGNRDSLAEDLRRVADGLAPLPNQLRVLGQRLGATSKDRKSTL